MIIEDVVDAVQGKRFPLLLTERIEHPEKLTVLLSPLVTNVLIFKGGMGQKQRQALINALKSIPNNGEGVIVATGRYLKVARLQSYWIRGDLENNDNMNWSEHIDRHCFKE